MGYRHKIGRNVVVARPSEYPGLIVELRCATTGALLLMAQAAAVTEPDEQMRMLAPIVELLADALVSWNLEEPVEDNGPAHPVPATLETLMTLELEFVMNILKVWLEESVKAMGWTVSD